jgi:hypothetical protein
VLVTALAFFIAVAIGLAAGLALTRAGAVVLGEGSEIWR